MAFCNNGEFIVAKVGNSFCNFVQFYYAINTNKIFNFPGQISGNLESPFCPGVYPPLPKAKVRFKLILNLTQPEVKERLKAGGGGAYEGLGYKMGVLSNIIIMRQGVV